VCGVTLENVQKKVQQGNVESGEEGDKWMYTRAYARICAAKVAPNERVKLRMLWHATQSGGNNNVGMVYTENRRNRHGNCEKKLLNLLKVV